MTGFFTEKEIKEGISRWFRDSSGKWHQLCIQPKEDNTIAIYLDGAITVLRKNQIIDNLEVKNE